VTELYPANGQCTESTAAPYSAVDTEAYEVSSLINSPSNGTPCATARVA
jgi:hypothetical protein